MTYPYIPSTARPPLHSNERQVPVFTKLPQSKEESIDEMQETDDLTQETLTDSYDPSYATPKLSTPQQFIQPFECDLDFSKNVAEMSTSRLTEKVQLNKTTKLSYSAIEDRICGIFKEGNDFFFIILVISRVFSRNQEFHCIILMMGDYSG